MLRFPFRIDSLAIIAVAVILMPFIMGNGCTSGKSPQEVKNKSGEIMELTGRISVKGNEPHSWLCLTDSSNRAYRLKGDLTDEIRLKYQQRTITIKGELLSLSRDPGIPAGFRVEEILAVDSDPEF